MASPMSTLRMAKDYLSHRLSTAKRRMKRQAPRARRMSVEPLEERALLSVVSGTIYDDRDGDGVRGTAEPALAGVTVHLDANDNAALGAGELAQTTDVDGSYAFADLAAGNYVVRQVVPAAYRQTTPAIEPARLFAVNYSTNKILELAPTTDVITGTFDNQTTSATDLSATAIGQEIYLGFSNGTIRVHDRAGVVQRTFTGNFAATGLAGNEGDGAHHVAVGPSETRSDVDFGNQALRGDIQGSVYLDADGDGQRDPEETPHAGVTV